MMLRIAEAIAKREKARALVTGESLGQVASQTLENMAVIQQAPRCRSCALWSVWTSRKSSTSAPHRHVRHLIDPDQDCCQLFVPKHPATKAGLADVEQAEAHYDAKEMVRLGVENAVEEEFSFP